MTQWIAHSKTDHAQSLYWPRDGYRFAADQQVVPVLVAELGKLLPHYALGFVKEGEGQEPLKVNGLYRISEKALTGLDAEALHALRGGSLSLAYAQLFSTHQLGELTKRADLLADAAKSQEVPESLDSLFDSGDDDLTFDFDS